MKAETAANKKREFTLIYGDADEERWTNPWPNDGYTYRSCHRCGINMCLNEERDRDLRAYCADCNYPEFRAPFEAGSRRAYLSVAA